MVVGVRGVRGVRECGFIVSFIDVRFVACKESGFTLGFLESKTWEPREFQTDLVLWTLRTP